MGPYRKIMLVDTRQLSNPEQDRGCREKNCIGRHPGIIDQLFRSGTGVYLIQSTWEAIEKETKLVIDFCNANRRRSVAKGTIMSAMCVQKGVEHGLLYLNPHLPVQRKPHQQHLVILQRRTIKYLV